jgi:hypothetical protein
MVLLPVYALKVKAQVLTAVANYLKPVVVNNEILYLTLHNSVRNCSSFIRLGDDCGWSDIWRCKSLNDYAVFSEQCQFGCCGPPRVNSFCCSDSSCLGCEYSNWYQPLSTYSSVQTSETPTSESTPTQKSKPVRISVLSVKDTLILFTL